MTHSNEARLNNFNLKVSRLFMYQAIELTEENFLKH